MTNTDSSNDNKEANTGWFKNLLGYIKDLFSMLLLIITIIFVVVSMITENAFAVSLMLSSGLLFIAVSFLVLKIRDKNNIFLFIFPYLFAFLCLFILAKYESGPFVVKDPQTGLVVDMQKRYPFFEHVNVDAIPSDCIIGVSNTVKKEADGYVYSLYLSGAIRLKTTSGNVSFLNDENGDMEKALNKRINIFLLGKITEYIPKLNNCGYSEIDLEPFCLEIPGVVFDDCDSLMKGYLSKKIKT
jgi:hypothetical protein